MALIPVVTSSPASSPASLPTFSGGGHTQPDQFKGRVVDQFGQRKSADVSSSDVNDANGHAGQYAHCGLKLEQVLVT